MMSSHYTSTPFIPGSLGLVPMLTHAIVIHLVYVQIALFADYSVPADSNACNLTKTHALI